MSNKYPKPTMDPLFIAHMEKKHHLNVFFRCAFQTGKPKKNNLEKFSSKNLGGFFEQKTLVNLDLYSPKIG